MSRTYTWAASNPVILGKNCFTSH